MRRIFLRKNYGRGVQDDLNKDKYRNAKKDENEVTQLSLFPLFPFLLSLSLFRNFMKDQIYRSGFSQDRLLPVQLSS